MTPRRDASAAATKITSSTSDTTATRVMSIDDAVPIIGSRPAIIGRTPTLFASASPAT